MNDKPIIDSAERLDHWLKDRPARDAAIIAHRVTMRVAPMWMQTLPAAYGMVKSFDLIGPPMLHLCLLSTIVQKQDVSKSSFKVAMQAAREAIATFRCVQTKRS